MPGRSATVLKRLRKLCMDLPETVEKLSHGAPTWWAGASKNARTFASFADNHHGSGRIAVWVKATLDEQQAMVRMAPTKFFVPPYVGPSGWVGVYLDNADAAWDELADLLREAWRLAAPKKLAAQHYGS